MRYDGRMRVRKAESGDAEAIAAVHVSSWQAAYRGLIPQDHLDGLDPAAWRPVWEQRLAETQWPGSGTLVVGDDHRVVGFASLVPARDEDQDPAAVAEIAAIYLAPEVWGRGVGATLMATALQTLAQVSYREVVLWVLDTNDRARRFYEGGGWRGDGALKRDGTLGFVLTELRYRRSLVQRGDAAGPPSRPR